MFAARNFINTAIASKKEKEKSCLELSKFIKDKKTFDALT
jgi:hypothetical protein